MFVPSHHEYRELTLLPSLGRLVPPDSVSSGATNTLASERDMASNDRPCQWPGHLSKDSLSGLTGPGQKVQASGHCSPHVPLGSLGSPGTGVCLISSIACEAARDSGPVIGVCRLRIRISCFPSAVNMQYVAPFR